VAMEQARPVERACGEETAWDRVEVGAVVPVEWGVEGADAGGASAAAPAREAAQAWARGREARGRCRRLARPSAFTT
jgi:hypothetical protein